ncbi:restriction endonuclease subunit S [Pseudomonas sp. B21-059]|uniref:restriction endonuclease subunit S n=1 Tax=Pseudomonas sp. B21-059 TaxID=2895496 RepID=UPI002234EA36|nr:restriction endonuclease subunit S [Pseudomonas sp. B21-059]UZE32812.1 restriction endonuclease subunit S [Pseudomonas sp. B21-059]
MSFEWIPFTELLLSIVDNRGRTCPVGDSGIPLIATNCISNNSLYPACETVRFVDDETYRTWFRGHPKPGDILFVCKGSPGRTNWVPDPVGFCIAQDMVAVRADSSKIYPKYLFAVLRSSIVQAQIDNMHVGSMIPHFKKGDFNKLNIPVPDQERQEFIGDYYFAISERISLLRETNSTLEAVARAFFKSWFVDFDPVRLKAEGLEPEGLDAATSALFPNSFDESDLGLVPMGWTTRPIYEMASYINGAAYKTFEPNSERRGLPIIKIAELKSGVTSQTAFSDIDMPAKYLIDTGDILFSWSGNPDTSIDTFVWGYEPALLNQHIFRVLPHDPIDRSFVLQVLKNLKPVFAELARNKQTTGLGHVTVADLKRLHIVYPPKAIIEQFNSIVEPIHQMIFGNEQRAHTLTQLRDTLLPRLISGQLRLPEATAATEKILSEAI